MINPAENEWYLPMVHRTSNIYPVNRVREDYLDGEFTHGRNDENADAVAAVPALTIQALQCRDQESECLPGAGLCTAENIASTPQMHSTILPEQRVKDGRVLDIRHFRKAGFTQAYVERETKEQPCFV